jgi:adenosine deaminase
VIDGPIVVLHDHLDGGVRPTTVLETAHRRGIATPVDEAGSLAEWLTIRPGMSFEEAFSRFDMVVSTLQDADSLRRVAKEAVEDLAADGVVHAELRFAPFLHTFGGLTPASVLAAVEAGLDDGAAASGLDARLILCAMRDQPVDVSMQTVRLAAGAAGRVVGIDLAGGEVGHPAADHAAAFTLAHEAGLGVTIHAGEMDGSHQVASALDTCEPHRIGHGWRLIDDCEVTDGRIVGVGPTASRVRDRGIPLEICLTSNACLGMPVENHPLRLLRDAGFRITLNPDDRSITTTSARRELDLAAAHHGFSATDLAQCSERAAAAAFLPDAQRRDLVAEVRAGWDPHPARLVHLAQRSRWEAGRSAGAYLPAEFESDGFIHLSSLHQVLSPANALYRGREDLVALVIDAHLVSHALVWEPGTGTLEWFPHLYGALVPDAVLQEIEFRPGGDGSFLIPPSLAQAVEGRVR